MRPSGLKRGDKCIHAVRRPHKRKSSSRRQHPPCPTDRFVILWSIALEHQLANRLRAIVPSHAEQGQRPARSNSHLWCWIWEVIRHKSPTQGRQRYPWRCQQIDWGYRSHWHVCVLYWWAYSALSAWHPITFWRRTVPSPPFLCCHVAREIGRLSDHPSRWNFMVSLKLLGAIDQRLKEIRFGQGESEFGWLSFCFVGNFAQLQPVVGETLCCTSTWSSLYHRGKAAYALPTTTFSLDHSYRYSIFSSSNHAERAPCKQNDGDYCALLNRLCECSLSATYHGALMTRMFTTVSEDYRETI